MNRDEFETLATSGHDDNDGTDSNGGDDRNDGDGNHDGAVVYVSTDLDVSIDPLAAYSVLGGEKYDFLLESADKIASSDPSGAFDAERNDGSRSAQTSRARYSFVGYDPAAVISVAPGETRVEVLNDEWESNRLDEGPNRTGGDPHADRDVLDALRETLPDAPRRGFPDGEGFCGGLVGFLAYNAVYDLWLDEQGIDRPETDLPDAQFVLSTKTLVFDHVEGTLSLVFTPLVSSDDDIDDRYDELVAERERVAELLEAANQPSFGEYDPTDGTAGPQAEYEEAVKRANEHVAAGDIYQGVISRKRTVEADIDSRALYAALRDVNPSPYMYLLGHDDLSIVGASPETLVSVQDGEIVSNPIAGTCPRGGSPMEDRRLAGELLADEKERSEHAMLVDLARNDVRRVAESGSVRVEEFMNVIKYSHVQHIESTVTGTLAENRDAFDAVRASFPAGTLTGAPKIRAMEIIDDLERTPRGVYGGGVGYVSWTGDADFAIAIRTATVSHGPTDEITVQAGAGIVADSDPTAEFEETEQKMGGVLAALEALEQPPETELAEVPK
ncbi:anthranilate synthase component I [Haladaptatus paucihalophilus DX253]|uniref:Anthranilate synthase component 1 n=1 Tax=Haladaptatus paucihalophilus DX253 TaxID=797209 RepID=E7R048_HALPU|nr:anthranilate synthase component I [Haladaptatus paucihalophilus]EFW89942.1 anthranilate synthase component I [Haladaptatus paucihalophilus DX253]SHK58880.1 anthranilate synthase, component I [Haladaptatus paucihalophilus DX253]